MSALELQRNQNATSYFGMNFFEHNTAGRLLKLDDKDVSDGIETDVIFQRDGSLALIKTE